MNLQGSGVATPPDTASHSSLCPQSYSYTPDHKFWICISVPDFSIGFLSPVGRHWTWGFPHGALSWWWTWSASARSSLWTDDIGPVQPSSASDSKFCRKLQNLRYVIEVAVVQSSKNEVQLLITAWKKRFKWWKGWKILANHNKN